MWLYVCVIFWGGGAGGDCVCVRRNAVFPYATDNVPGVRETCSPLLPLLYAVALPARAPGREKSDCRGKETRARG
jgi:hypothetical protein